MKTFLTKILSKYVKDTVSVVPPKPIIQRSSNWKKTRDNFIKENPKCSLCNRTINLEVHHMIPLHLKPELELDTTNLIVLCENIGMNCHFLWGHLTNWSSWNPDVKADTSSYNLKILTKPFYQ